MDNELTLYSSFIKEIKELIYRRQYEAMKRVNAELIQRYWEIGEEIDRQQREKGWGKSIVEVLAKELQKNFPAFRVFRRATFGECEILSLNIRRLQCCH